MSSPKAPFKSEQCPGAEVRTPRRMVALGMTAILIALVGWTVWLWWSAPRVRDLRQAVERGRTYLRQGRPDLAFQAVSDARDDEPGAGEAVAMAGKALIRMGELRVARVALERSLKLNPDQFEVAVTLAELHVDLGNGERGAAVFEAAARLRPRDPRVWLALAKVFDDMYQLPKAAQAYEKVIELDPEQKQALIGVIRCWVVNNEPGRAEPWVVQALGRYPNDPTILGLAARQSFTQNRLEEAIARADRALELDPQNGNALRARANVWISRSNWARALPDAECAAKAQPNDLETLQLLSMIETRLGLDQRAAATLKKRNQAQARVNLMDRLTKEMEEQPEDPELRWRLGQAALEGGWTVLAARCFEAALALDSGYQPARESLTALRQSQPQVVPAPRSLRTENGPLDRAVELSGK